MGGDKHIAEIAHVIPHGEMGPRHSERPAEPFETDTFENLILLCPSCHTIIDKDPSGYSRSTLQNWKANHLTALANKQGIRTYDNRNQARVALIAAMAENRAIWTEFAPCDGSNFEYDPESERAKTWAQRIRGAALPNHFRIIAIITANIHHLNEDEQRTFAQYQEHVRGLSERHICSIAGTAIRYPAKMDNIFT